MASSTSISARAAPVQSDHSDFDLASVVMSPSVASPTALKSPTPSTSSFWGRLRTPVAARTPSIASSRISSYTPSIGPAAHSGRACEDVDEEGRLNKEMAQSMSDSLVNSLKQIETLETIVKRLQDELKLQEEVDAKSKGNLPPLLQRKSFLQQGFDQLDEEFKGLETDEGNSEMLNSPEKSCRDDISLLKFQLTEMEDKLAEMSNAALLDCQKIEYLNEAIAKLKASHHLDVAGLQRRLAGAEDELERKSSELVDKEQALQELIAKIEDQDMESDSNYLSNDELIEKLAFAESEVEVLKARIEELKEAQKADENTYVATLSLECELLSKLTKDVNEARCAYQEDLAFKKSEAEKLHAETKRQAQVAAAELNNTRHDLGTKLDDKNRKIDELTAEVDTKKQFILKLFTEIASVKEENESLTYMLQAMKEYADVTIFAEDEQNSESTPSRSSSAPFPNCGSRRSKPKSKGTGHIKAENKKLKGIVDDMITQEKESKAKVAGLEAEVEELRAQLAASSLAP